MDGAMAHRPKEAAALHTQPASPAASPMASTTFSHPSMYHGVTAVDPTPSSIVTVPSHAPFHPPSTTSGSNTPWLQHPPPVPAAAASNARGQLSNLGGRRLAHSRSTFCVVESSQEWQAKYAEASQQGLGSPDTLDKRT
ncbi:hypothetical protein HaLaN_19060 [Haematococcus lacustris]|uniref:Uncharacterized protein n=1 Tax=Haematococcus lacustris TaxID=44745 RepID=A0A699ZZP1_HAELA|nr:hypothetical protein HaLaN_19060 [Haematococcus lacustris]